MRSRLLFILAALLMIGAALAFGVAMPRPTEVEAQAATEEPGSGDVALTIYNQGSALVQDRRMFALDAGTNLINFTDVASSIDPTSVSFNSLTDPDGTVVVEQNYVYDLVDSSVLLNRYVDQRIEVVTEDGTTYSGVLLSGRGDIILRQDDGQVFVLRTGYIRDMRFPDLPGGLITRPTLRWLVESASAGEQTVELTYLTGGMSWTADYIVLLNDGSTALDLNGWITLNNTSGAAYRDATVKLIAGDVNRLPDAARMEEMAMDGIVAAGAPMPTQGVEQRNFNEYNLYEIARPVTVADNEQKQVEFVSGSGVAATTFYVYNASQPYYGYLIDDPGYGNTGITDVQNYLEFTTDEESGLGQDLPAGRMRVYQEDIDGAALLIGENFIDHTPEGETVQIFLGNAFDLVGERIQTNFNRIGTTTVEERYAIRLRNRKDDETVEIRVPETLFRWSNWEIVAATHEYTQTDSNTIEFRVNVEPGAETMIEYTVRYTWF